VHVIGDSLKVGSARGGAGRAMVELRNPLYRTSYALVINTVGTTVVGLGFWAVAAHFYDQQTLGRSSALISTLLLVANIAQLNMINNLPRFLPRTSGSAGRFIGYSYGATASVALIGGLVCVTVLPRVNSQWGFMAQSLPLRVGFVAACVIWIIFALEDSALTGLRRSTVIPVENVTYGILKLILLPIMAWSLPSTGILAAWTVPLLAVVPVINWLIFRRFVKNREPVPPGQGFEVRDIVRFASVDHVGFMIGQAYSTFLPLLVLSTLGPGATGTFYIPWTIASGLVLVGTNFGTALLVEGSSAPHRLVELTRGVLARSVLVTGLGAVVIAAGAHEFLRIYGSQYAAEGSVVLAVLAISAVFRAVIQIAFTLDRIAVRVWRIGLTHLTLAALVLGGSWQALSLHMGIDGVAFAWGASNLLIALVRLPTVVAAAWPRRPGRHRVGHPAEAQIASPSAAASRSRVRGGTRTPPMPDHPGLVALMQLAQLQADRAHGGGLG